VRNYADQKHGIKLNFSSTHTNYYSALKYTTKEDKDYLQSQAHPDLSNGQPQTQDASDARKGNLKRKRGDNSKRKRTPRLSVFEVSQIAVNKGIHTRMKLLALANSQKKEGKTDLAEFVANRYEAVDEAIRIGWDIERAPAALERRRKTCIEVLNAAIHGKCAPGCNKGWLSMGEDLLRRNSISHAVFSQAVESLLREGREKYRNLLLVGPHHCGKTFLLNPLNTIYQTFTNPATSTEFCMVGGRKLRNHFLKRLPLVGKSHPMARFTAATGRKSRSLTRPENPLDPQDIEFTKDAPIFATSKDKIVYVKGGVMDSRECGMTRARWRIFKFQVQIPHDQQANILPYPSCFSEFIIGPSQNT